MPCTLQPWEIAFEERRINKEKYGLDVSSVSLITGLLCEACRTLEGEYLEHTFSPELKLWWAAHQKMDAERE